MDDIEFKIKGTVAGATETGGCDQYGPTDDEGKTSVAVPEPVELKLLYLRPGAGAGAEIIFLINIYCSQ